MAMNYKLFPA